MKKFLALLGAATLGLLCVVMVISGIGWAQAPVNDDQTSIWLSSAPIPEGVQVQSLPDQLESIGAVDETAATYNASLRISGSALKPRESNVEWTGAGGGGCIYASSGSTYAVFNAPVYLPQGATVKYVRMYYFDTNATYNSSAWLTVYDLYGTIVSEWGVNSSGESGNGYGTTSEFTHTVDYLNYSYVINWRPYDLGNDTQVCGFRIYYQAPPGATFLPTVIKSDE